MSPFASKPGPARRQAGLSLMELMISITISLFLLVGLVASFGTSNRTYLELSRSAQQIENGRYAIQILTDDVTNAAYYGRAYSQITVPAALPSPCETADTNNLREGAALPIQGYSAENTAGTPSAPATSCIATANRLAGTDVLVVRRADSQTTASASLVAQEVYVQANADPEASTNPIINFGAAANFTLQNTQQTPPTTAPIRKYHVHVYFIAPCSIPNGGGSVCTGTQDDGGSPIPTLKRLELKVDTDGVRKMVIVPLVEGIENFQVDYGLDTDNDGVQDSYTAAPAAIADWTNVVSVRLNVLARNLEPSSGYADAKIYDMGLASTGAAIGGPYKRHVYNAFVRLVNPSSRRETP